MKRKSLLFLLLLALGLPWAVNAQETVTIGNVESTSTSYHVPYNSLYVYSFVEQLYSADEIAEAGGMAGTISTIRFYHKPSSTPSAALTNHIVVYMMNVDKTSFSATNDYVQVSALDIVFDGDWTIPTTTGWVDIVLDNPFEYDGTSDLMVAVHENSSGYSSRYFQTTTTTSAVCTFYHDTYNPDPYNLGSYSGTKAVNANRANIQLDITPSGSGPTCPKPTNLAVSNVTSSNASFSWTKGGDETEWVLEYSTNADFTNAVSVPRSGIPAIAIDDFAPATTYYARVKALCGGGDESRWSNTVNFTTDNPCAAPTNLVISDITTSSATLSWTAGYQETSWTVKYKKSSDTEYITETVNAPTISLTRLDGLTTYNVQVYNCIEEGSAYLSGNFTTAASIPLIEEFGTSIPTGWSQQSGLLADVLNGTALTSGTAWYFGTANGVFDNHARMNIYGTSRKHWLIMPSVPMENNVQLSFEVAYTDYNGTAAAPAQTGTDDKFVVLVSTDNMATWTILRQWDNAGSEYVLNDLNVTPIPVNFDLSSYAGQNVIVAFYGESTVSNADNNLHIDNVSIDYIPDCPKPTVLTVSDLNPHTAQLSWTSDANAWQICLNDNEDDPIDVTTNPYTLENLADDATYTVKVRANCGNDVYSEWSSDVSFTTPIACPAPTGLAATEITGHTAKLNWTGNSEGYNVYYRTKVSVEEGGIFEGFKTTTIPTGWSRYNTLLSDDVLNGTTALTSSNGGWSFGSANGVFDSHAKINIYSTSTKYWLVTPSVEVAANYVFDFDLALTKYSGTLQPVDPTQQLDDKFIVLISTDDMATWTILRQWDNAGSEYVYNNIACTATGEHVSFDLSAYVGQNVYIAFYGESTAAGGDNELHIDNVLVGIPVPAGEWMTATTDTLTCTLSGLNPLTDYEAYVESICTGEQSHVTNYISFTTDVACPAPTGLTASNVGPNSVELSWTGNGETSWELVYSWSNEQETYYVPIEINENPYTLTGLTPERTYTVTVYAHCGEEGSSLASNSITFTTLEACPDPEGLTVSDITYNSATVAWNGFNDSYLVSYRTAAYEAAPFKQDFENELGNWTFTSMNAANDIGATGANHAGIHTIAAHNGSYGFRFSSYTQKTADETYDQYLVSPELTVTGNLKFYFKKYNTSAETLYVGYSTTTNDLDAFTWSENLAPTTTWQEYTQELASDVKYIAFHYFGNYTYYVYVDDITIGAYDVPAGEWETVEATESPVILTGLTPETNYEVKLQGFCDGEPTEETAIVTFTTPEQTTVTQTIELTEGWNWVSLYVEFEDAEQALLALEEVLGEHGLKISSMDDYTTYEDEEWGAMGDLEELTNDQMYMVLVDDDIEVTLVGMPSNPADYTITILPNNWTWIGFPSAEAIAVEDAFADFEAEDGDKIQGVEDYTKYEDGEWGAMGDLEELTPGQGYMYFSNSSEEKDLVISTGAKVRYSATMKLVNREKDADKAPQGSSVK